MTTHVALLRGINVGSAKRVAMPALRRMAGGLGYADVATLLNSGNLLLTTAEESGTVRQRLEQGIEQTFGMHVDVVVRTMEQLRAVLADNPFRDADPSRVVVAFLAEHAPMGVQQRLAALAAEDEPFLVRDLEVHVFHGHGQAGSELAAKFAQALAVTATVRNLRTVTKLVERGRVSGTSRS